MKKLTSLLAATALTAAATVPASAEKWDMPMAYSASNFHSATGAEFAKCVTTGTGGEIEIVTHPSGSLFKAPISSARSRPGKLRLVNACCPDTRMKMRCSGLTRSPFLRPHSTTATSCGRRPDRRLKICLPNRT